MESNPFKKFRESLGKHVTQLQIARLAEKTEATIRNWENGRSVPSLSDAGHLGEHVYKRPRKVIEEAIIQWHRQQELATAGK